MKQMATAITYFFLTVMSVFLLYASTSAHSLSIYLENEGVHTTTPQSAYFMLAIMAFGLGSFCFIGFCMEVRKLYLNHG